MNPAFSPGALKDLEPVVQGHLQTFTRCLTYVASQNHGVVDMTTWWADLLFAVSQVQEFV